MDVQSKGPDPKLTLYLCPVTNGIAQPAGSYLFLYGMFVYSDLLLM